MKYAKEEDFTSYKGGSSDADKTLESELKQ